jgi:hypothetical protein
MAKEKKNINLELWNQVCETNPAITKRVTTRGGFTSIDAQAQIKRATELWGSFGKDWGLRNFRYDMIHDVGISLQAEFYYPATDCDNALGRFPIASDMVYKPNDDCFKKLQTDCITKALSRLGFNSDVFEGKYDDNRYVAEMNKKYNKATDKPVEKQIAKPTKAPALTVAEKGVFQLIVDEFTDAIDADGLIVDRNKLKQAIWDIYGKYPIKKSSVSTVVGSISASDVIVPNDFIEGIE